MKSPENQQPAALVVEDDGNLQTLIKEQLASIGVTATVLSNGPDALEWLDSNHADLVILDLMLPGMDGIEICRRIRRQHSLAALPILMLSALGGMVDHRIDGIRAGANDFLPKPYDLREFLARVKMLLDVRAEGERTASLLDRYTGRVLRHQARVDPASLDTRRPHLATVMFADLRGFTTLSAHVDSDAIFAVLDEFFDAMLAIVDHYHGTVFDLIGDEFLAAFNIPFAAPDSTLLAVEAALSMGERLRDLQKEWNKLGYQVGMGIGLHRGEVVLGNVGAASLMRYTIVGNVVNVAHRLVDLAGDGEIVLSASVRDDLAELPGGVALEEVGAVEIKGVDDPQHLYRIRIAA